MSYSIGQVADMLEVSVQSLRLWERHQLIPKPSRSPTNRRRYKDSDISVIREYLSKKYDEN